VCERVCLLLLLKQFEVILFYLRRYVCVCRYNKNIIHRRVQGVCLCMWAGDGLCLEFMFVCVFFFLPANAKKGKKKKLRNTCVCVGKRSCVPVSSRFPPSANLCSGGGVSGDIREQCLSAPAKVVKEGLISSHAGARGKNNLFLQELNTIYPSRQVFQDGRQA